MDEEIFEIYKRNLPFITRKKEIVLQILSNTHNIILEKREKYKQKHLAFIMCGRWIQEPGHWDRTFGKIRTDCKK